MTIVDINVFLISLHLVTTSSDFLQAKSDYCTCLRGKYSRNYNGKLEFTFCTRNCSGSAKTLKLDSVKFTCIYGFEEENFELDFDMTKNIEIKNDSVTQDGFFILLYKVALDDCQLRIINISVIKPEHSPLDYHYIHIAASPRRKQRHISITSIFILISLLLALIIVTLISYIKKRSRRHRLSETVDEVTVLYHPAPTVDLFAKKSVLVVTVDYGNNSVLMDLLRLLDNCRELDAVYPEKEAHRVSLNTNRWISETVNKCDCFIIVLSDNLMSTILFDSINELFDDSPMTRVNHHLFLELQEKIECRQKVECEICLMNMNTDTTLMASFKDKYHKFFSHSSVYHINIDCSSMLGGNPRLEMETLLARLYHNINVPGRKEDFLSSYIEKSF